MDDNILNIYLTTFSHICYQFLNILLIYYLYHSNYELNINYLWFSILVSYIDWLIWKDYQKSIFLFIFLIGLLLIFWKKDKIHNNIEYFIQNSWNDMDFLIKSIN